MPASDFHAERAPVTQQPVADVVGLFTLIAAVVFSKEVAAVVGPYMVIVIASAIGASFSLARRKTTTRGAALLFFCRVVGLALILTVGSATLASTYQPDLQERLLLAPIALIIGFIGDGWPAVFRRFISWFWLAVDTARGGNKGDQP